jgi:type I restriction enzyme S subunit
LTADAAQPPGWAVASLADICSAVEQIDLRTRFDKTFTYLEISSIDRLTNRLFDSAEISVQNAPLRARQAVTEGDTLFSTVRTNLRNIAIVDSRFSNQIASTGFCVLRPRPPVDCRYVYYYILTNGLVESVTTLQRGVSYPAVRDADVRAQPIPLAPPAEQRRIVEKIAELFSLIEAGELALERARRLLERYRQSVLKAAVTGELTRHWRERHRGQIEPADALLARILKARREAWERDRFAKLTKAGKLPKAHRWKAAYEDPASPVTANLPKLPDGWVWATLGACATSAQNGLYKPKERYGRGRPILRIDDYQDF